MSENNSVTGKWKETSVALANKPVQETKTCNPAPTKDLPINVQKFRRIVQAMAALYERKNEDYGNAFSEIFAEEGLSIARIKIHDKFKRFEQLSKGEDARVKGESIEDTLMDLANYAVMTLIELENEKP